MPAAPMGATFAFTNLDNLPIEEKQRYVLPVVHPPQPPKVLGLQA